MHGACYYLWYPDGTLDTVGLIQDKFYNTSLMMIGSTKIKMDTYVDFLKGKTLLVRIEQLQ